jgi:prepilin-type processing-associated H-X9-DG protein
LIRWGNTSLLPNLDRTVSNNPPANATLLFGSTHGAGWHAAFCDGHVQLIGWAIDPTTHQTMASRNGVKRLGYPVVNPANIPK